MISVVVSSHRGRCRVACLRVLLVVAGAFFAGRRASGHEGHAALPTKGATVQGDLLMLSPGARKAIGLQTRKVTLNELPLVVRANATVVAPWNRQARVASLIKGKVQSVEVRPGDTVAAGQELARIESLDLETLQLELLQAYAERALAERVLRQRQELAKGGGVAGTAVWEAEASLREKTIRREIARQKLLALGLTVEAVDRLAAGGAPIRSLPVTSPIAGIIAESEARIGETVEPTQHLYHVVDLSTVWVSGQVLEADAARVRQGMPVRVTLQALQREFTGMIDFVDLKLTTRRTLIVNVVVQNPQRLLRPGMFGRLSIEVQPEDKVIVCPADALLKGREGDFALLEQSPGKYRRRYLRIGRRAGQDVEILDGLFPGDQVVTAGSHEIASLLGKSTAKAPAKADEWSVARKRPAPSNASIGAPSAQIVAQGTLDLPTDRKFFASASVSGRISRVLVRPGQQVEAGQVLAEIESLELRNLQLDLLLAVARRNLIRSTIERRAALDEQQLLRQRDRWQLETEQTTLENQMGSLARKLTLIGLADDEVKNLVDADLTAPQGAKAIRKVLPLRAPGKGRVASFNLVAGQVIQPDDRLFEIHNLETMWVQAFVFEQDSVRIRPEQKAVVRLAADPTFQATGSVARTSPATSLTDRVFSVWIELDNRRHVLKEGMSARVRISVEPPPASLAADGGQHKTRPKRPGRSK